MTYCLNNMCLFRWICAPRDPNQGTGRATCMCSLLRYQTNISIAVNIGYTGIQQSFIPSETLDKSMKQKHDHQENVILSSQTYLGAI
jgi:hypothetical protein